VPDSPLKVETRVRTPLGLPGKPRRGLSYLPACAPRATSSRICPAADGTTSDRIYGDSPSPRLALMKRVIVNERNDPVEGSRFRLFSESRLDPLTRIWGE
jgi:hypothetical protein